MGKIKILPEKVANKIAAGEVVERPASVVKELVENAIDANASNIKVEIEGGGIKKILVTDNGEGMDKEDLQKCVKRHGTSKIVSEEDLLSIKSMGFRGEALSSIAAVSRVKIKSKVSRDSVGTLIEVEDGSIQRTSPVGIPTGTSVLVEDLFYNIPARKKFLKTVNTESRHITEVVTNNAIAFPKIGFYLAHNKRVIIDLPKDQEPNERIKDILGETIYSNLIPVFFEHTHFEISGFVSKPQVSLDSRYKQYTFVNLRRVKDKVIAAAVREAYGTLLPQKSYPIFVLFLNLPYEMVDVNVHPRKEEIKFVNSNFIFNSVKQSVLSTLEKEDLTFRPKDRSLTYEKQDFPPQRSDFSKQLRQHRISQAATSHDRKGLKRTWDYKADVKDVLKKMLPWEAEELEKADKPLEILHIHKLYLLAQTSDGLMIIDQHAAHERILYEQFLESFKGEKDSNKSQPLLLAQTFDLPASEALSLKENIEIFKKLGFEIEEFGKNSFKINSVPAVLKDRNIASLITSVIGDLQQEKAPRDVDGKQERALSFLACRSAIKAGDYLGEEERRDLLEKLAQTKTKYTCPHGRPVKIEISLKELSRMFKRS